MYGFPSFFFAGRRVGIQTLEIEPARATAVDALSTLHCAALRGGTQNLEIEPASTMLDAQSARHGARPSPTCVVASRPGGMQLEIEPARATLDF